jgi:hypothetical protein
VIRNIVLNEADQMLLDQAATSLDAVGRTAESDETAVLALRAADLLATAGARSSPSAEVSDTRADLRQALSLLGRLSTEIFRQPAVTGAVAAALNALAAALNALAAS